MFEAILVPLLWVVSFKVLVSVCGYEEFHDKHFHRR